MPLTSAVFDRVRACLRQEAAIVLEPGKEYLVEARLGPLARRLGYPDLDAFAEAALCGRDPSGRRRLVEALATNETSFFRDLHPFEALRKDVLPEVLKRRASERELNVWCGAASSGQEPYSILMTMLEHFPAIAEWKVRFFATDLSEEMLERCRAGRYSQFEINRGLPAALLVKYFERHGLDWTAKEDLRRRIDFAVLNLVKEWPPMPAWDVVFLRNVLIYFDNDVKRKLVDRVRAAMHPEGYLFLGGAESLNGVHEGFERIVYDRTTVHRPTRS
ncbi:MAG TPA: CheR family methyltransferase [Planctomycetota bacterium]|nr:CheR family methyltransferase [Planctomycetota bacterium]